MINPFEVYQGILANDQNRQILGRGADLREQQVADQRAANEFGMLMKAAQFKKEQERGMLMKAALAGGGDLENVGRAMLAGGDPHGAQIIAQGRLSREGLAREAARAQHEKEAGRRFDEMLKLRQQPPPSRPVYDAARGVVVDPAKRTATPVTDTEGKPLGAKTSEKAMSAGAAKSLFENQQNLRRAEQALALVQGQTVDGVEGDKDATGWKGFLSTTETGDKLLQTIDPKGVSTRAAIADLGSMIIHDRSGAAVTAAEYPRLRPFIPKVTDDQASAKKKLERFATEYRKIQQEMVDFYSESGFKVPSGALRESTGKAPAATSGIDALLEKYK